MHIWLKVWQWTKRKHPNSTAKYRRDRYIKTIGNRRWVFHDRETGTHLTKMNQIPIKRFIKVQKDKYDVKNIAYWEKRMYMNAKDSIFESVTLTKLFMVGVIIVIVILHLITSKMGNSSTPYKTTKPRRGWKLNNLTLLHPDCHTELHGIYNLRKWRLSRHRYQYVRLMKPKT